MVSGMFKCPTLFVFRAPEPQQVAAARYGFVCFAPSFCPSNPPEVRFCMQMSCFWNPSAWPDLLGAYRPWTRRIAVAHVLLALYLARVFVCNREMLTWFWRGTIYVWFCSGDIGTKAAICLMAMVFLMFLISIPLGYLWMARYFNLYECFSKEASSLKADIQKMLQAVVKLEQHQAKLAMLPDQALSPPCSSTPLPNASLSKDLAQLKPHEAALGPCSAKVSADPNDSHMALDDGYCPPQHTVSGAATHTTFPEVAAASEGCKEDSKVLMMPFTPVKDAANPLAAAGAGEEQQESQMFEARVTQALQSASQTIANLTARLEAMIYLKGGVCVQGYAPGSVAWAM